MPHPKVPCGYHDATAVCDRCPESFATDGHGFPHPGECKWRQALRVCKGCDRAVPFVQWNAERARCEACCQVFAVARATLADTPEGELRRIEERARRRHEQRRPCTVCLARGDRVDATHVAGTSDGFEWFECGQHEPTDNVAQVTRAKLTPIREWFAKHGLPVPGDE